MSESCKQALLLIAITVCLVLVLNPNALSSVSALGQRRAELPRRVLSQAEMQQFTTTANSGEIVMVGANGVLIDQGTQAVRVGTADVSVITGNTERLRVLNNGNVGIGITNPGERLEVNGNAMVGGEIRGVGSIITGDSLTPVNGVVRITHGGGTNYIQSALKLEGDSVADLAFTGMFGGPEHMRIKTNGYVGIGTNAPAETLDVNGRIWMRGTDFRLGSSANGRGAGGTAMVHDNGNVLTINYGNTFRNLYFASWAGIGQADPQSPLDICMSTVPLSQSNAVSYKGFGQLVLCSPTPPSATNGSTYGYTKMGYDHSVGSWGAGFIQVVVPNLWSPALLLQPSGGNVGIGVTNPNASLQLSNAIQNRKIILYEASTNDHEYFGFGINPSSLRYQVAVGADHVFFAASSISTSTELMRIMHNGNVGIGTANPQAKLHVFGSIVADSNLSMRGTDFFLGSAGTGRGNGGRAMVQSDYNVLTVNFGGDFRNVSFGSNVGIGVGVEQVNSPLTISGAGYFSPTGSWLGGSGTYTGFGASIVCSHGVWSQAFGFIVSSDHRIKKDIRSVSNTLEKISLIDVVSYNHIDEKSGGPVGYGVVAQQIHPIVPEVTFYQKNKIPCVYANAYHNEISSDQVRVFSNFSSPEVKEGLSLVVNIKDKEYKVKIISVSLNHVDCDKWENYSANDEVFVYGVEVEDFMCVDKDQLGLMALSGVKELIQENQQLKERLSRVESILSQLIR